jgi:hypothetical protein
VFSLPYRNPDETSVPLYTHLALEALRQSHRELMEALEAYVEYDKYINGDLPAQVSSTATIFKAACAALARAKEITHD